ncbi:MarR family winged helix-turn-helix transcriptional regulator [Frankia sp. QA3]|uniref:MarR family winged helix-turn-helix transcriptional regulator n=1 Tax=Frankia sp. QA3 TaxID=710111 RepID=UPI000269BECF|nr:MarR family transcriptional regulator [Frankia sp. QA3]EIV92376.1 transcriptional regulator [Frankia sp. QA3]
MNPAPAPPTALAALERALADVARILADRATVGDLARRSGFDLPAASWALLEYLDGHGPMPVSAVAACHGVDVSSVTPRIKRLERDGLISRRRDARDARVHLIHITDRGRHALDSVHAARRDLLGAAIAGLDPTRLGIAAEVLKLIADRLSTTQRRIHAHAPAP